MDPTKCLNKFVQTETEEVSSVVCEADSSSSLAGDSWKFTTTDGTNDFTYQPFYVVDGVGDDPTLGSQEVDAITNRADSSTDLRNKYFKIYDGISSSEIDYYVAFTVAGAGYDPGLGQYEQTSVKLILDTSGNLDGKYWSLYTGADQEKYVWYSKDSSSSDPDPGSVGVGHGIKVSYTEDDSVETIARLTAAAISDDIIKGNDTYFSAIKAHSAVSTAQICTVACVADVSSNLNNTWFTFAIPTVANTAATGQVKYCVWFNVDAGGTAPTLLNHTMVEVGISAGDTATTIGGLAATAIDALTGTGAGNSSGTVTITNTYKGVCDAAADGVTWRDSTLTGFTFVTTTAGIDPGIIVTNDQTGNPTTAVNGNIPVGTAFSVLQNGVDALNASAGDLEDFTKLMTINVAEDATDTVVCTALTAGFNALSGWVAVARSGAEDHITDVTHATRGNCTNTADGNIGGVFAISITAGVDPTNSTITSISVAIAEDANAAAVGTATLAAVEAVSGMDLLMGIGLATATLTLTNRWGGVVADVVDVATSWSTLTTTTQGSATVQTNMGQSLSTANYFIRPPDDEVWYIRQINFTLSDDDCTDAGKFGNISALSAGLNIRVCEVDGTVIKTLAGTIKTNLELCGLGACVIEAGTNDTLAVYWDLVSSFGQEVAISGNLGEYLEIDVNDNLNGLVGFYALCQGHIKATLGA